MSTNYFLVKKQNKLDLIVGTTKMKGLLSLYGPKNEKEEQIKKAIEDLLDEKNNSVEEGLHVGKNSFKNRFTFSGKFESWSKWKEHLEKALSEGFAIEDEYGQSVSLEVFSNLVSRSLTEPVPKEMTSLMNEEGFFFIKGDFC